MQVITSVKEAKQIVKNLVKTVQTPLKCPGLLAPQSLSVIVFIST